MNERLLVDGRRLFLCQPLTQEKRVRVHDVDERALGDERLADRRRHVRQRQEIFLRNRIEVGNTLPDLAVRNCAEQHHGADDRDKSSSDDWSHVCSPEVGPTGLRREMAGCRKV
jgi:hypothetical protein